MANNLTNAAELLMLDWINIVGTPTRPSSPLQIALFTTAPNQETGSGGTEVSAGGYARQNVTFGSASAGAASNSGAVTFGPASASWGTVVAAGIYDSAGTPVLLWSGNLSASKTIDNGDSFQFAIGQVTVALD
jgi:hypothetical protein